MRKNTQDTFKAWRAGRSYKGGGSAIWTDGVHIYSYGTPIVQKDGERVFFNNSRYSVTTSCQQGGLRVLMDQAGISCEFVEGKD